MAWIRVAPDGAHFVRSGTGERFVVWGVNYDHDASSRLLEDYWEREWPTVAQDFHEIKELGANVVRIHLQVARFMNSPLRTNEAALKQLSRLVRLAEKTGLYLDLTGLGCYRRADVPDWYQALPEGERWAAQARFWEAVAKVCARSPAVFCFDLMNEPILPGGDKRETDWLTGELGGFTYVQRITLDLAGRSQDQVARAWLDTLVSAIRRHDRHHMITLGVIPWALVFPGAPPQFYTKEVGERLDFVSVHFYPKKGEVPAALTALDTYRVGKPIVVEEMFPLECSVDELDAFVEGSRGTVEGWIGFYWGKTIAEYAREKPTPAADLTRRWLEYFRDKSRRIRAG